VLSEITHQITSLIGDYGIYAVFGLMAIDAVLPAASELVMVYGGALAAGAFAGREVTLFGEAIPSGFDAFLAIAMAGSLGYLVGSVGGWAIGLYGGRPYLERHGRWLHLSPATLDKAERWFDRWEDWAVFVGRITPVARSFVSIPAGVFRTPLVRYIVLTAIGSALWAFALAGIGWALGANWERFHHAFRYADIAFAAGVVALVAYLIVRRRRSTRLAPGRAPDSAR
jgi:membrane protein DedA with SNARE-associated domain